MGSIALDVTASVLMQEKLRGKMQAEFLKSLMVISVGLLAEAMNEAGSQSWSQLTKFLKPALCSEVHSKAAQNKACACSSPLSPEGWMQSFPSVLFPTQGLVSIEETILVIASELNGEICMRVIWSLLLADSVLFQRLHLFGFFLQCHQVFLARMAALS